MGALVSVAPLGSYLVRRSSSSASERPSVRMISSSARQVPVRVRLRLELASVSLHCRPAVSSLAAGRPHAVASCSSLKNALAQAHYSTIKSRRAEAHCRQLHQSSRD